MFSGLIFGEVTFFSLVIEFLISGILIVIFGTLLSKYGDIIADITGLGGAWVGTVLLATITSIPEVAASLSSVTIYKEPNLGIGNVFGSNAFNLVILAILDLLQGTGAFTTEIKLSHILPASFGIILIGLAIMGIIASKVITQYASFISLISTGVIAFTFLVGTKMVFRLEQSEKMELFEEDFMEHPVKPRRLYLKFAISAILIAASGCWLSVVGDKIANFPIATGAGTITLGATFVGSILVAIMTSMPEVVVSISALKIGAIDLAVANVLGSNTFNMIILFFMELCSGSTGIFAFADIKLLIPAFICIIETAILISGLIYRSKRSFLLLGLDNLALLTVYIVGNWVFFKATVKPM